MLILFLNLCFALCDLRCPPFLLHNVVQAQLGFREVKQVSRNALALVQILTYPLLAW